MAVGRAGMGTCCPLLFGDDGDSDDSLREDLHLTAGEARETWQTQELETERTEMCSEI